jgi:hypothetical protein
VAASGANTSLEREDDDGTVTVIPTAKFPRVRAR